VCHGWCVTAGVSRLVCHGWCVTAGVSRPVCHGWYVTAGVSRLVCHGWCVVMHAPSSPAQHSWGMYGTSLLLVLPQWSRQPAAAAT
jgi:hypothetical protein